MGQAFQTMNIAWPCTRPGRVTMRVFFCIWSRNPRRQREQLSSMRLSLEGCRCQVLPQLRTAVERDSVDGLLLCNLPHTWSSAASGLPCAAPNLTSTGHCFAALMHAGLSSSAMMRSAHRKRMCTLSGKLTRRTPPPLLATTRHHLDFCATWEFSRAVRSAHRRTSSLQRRRVPKCNAPRL